jgi:hypothetical protein
MGAEQAIFVRRGDRVTMEADGDTLTDVSVEDHLTLVRRAAEVLGFIVVPANGVDDETAALWLDEAPTFGHQRDTFTCRIVADDRVHWFRGPGELLAIGMGNAARTYAKAIRGNIIAFRKRRRRLAH